MTTIHYKQPFKKDFFEEGAWQEGNFICGIDEVGRGCLAGPVVTAAVIMITNKKSRLVKDSKLLEHKELLRAYQWLKPRCWYSYGIINHRDIDTHNIYQATLSAMKRAVMQLLAQSPIKPSKIVIDAMPLNLSQTPYSNVDVVYFPKGESKSISIAAASIIAKIKRDDIMRRLDLVFPHYRFAQHRGYGTQLHRQAIIKHGSSIIHRTRFLRNKTLTSETQLELFSVSGPDFSE